MKHLILCAATALFLSACGGGGSSSDSAGTRYSGAQNLTISGGNISDTSSVRFVMTVNDNTVFITDEGNPATTAQGTLNGAQFTASGSSSGTVDGVTCTINVTYTGTISDNRTQGTLRGNAPCRSAGFAATLNVSGSFSATTGSGKVVVATDIASKLASLVNQ